MPPIRQLMRPLVLLVLRDLLLRDLSLKNVVNQEPCGMEFKASVFQINSLIIVFKLKSSLPSLMPSALNVERDSISTMEPVLLKKKLSKKLLLLFCLFHYSLFMNSFQLFNPIVWKLPMVPM